MLVLTRRIGERIVVKVGDHEFTIKLVCIKPGEDGGAPRVRIGFDAPESVKIDREEVARAREQQS